MKYSAIMILIILFLAVYARSSAVDKFGSGDGILQTGEQLYNQNCLACHQANGMGVRNMFPPLAGNEKITGPADEIISIVLFGLEGPIEVNRMQYNQVMPAQDNLDDRQIAEILTWIRNSWGNKASPVKPEEVAKIRKQGKPAE